MTTQSFIVVQTFGQEYSCYKIMVLSKNRNRYLVWYYYPIQAVNNQEVLITISNYNSWERINNPKNGKSSCIKRVNKIS